MFLFSGYKTAVFWYLELLGVYKYALLMLPLALEFTLKFSVVPLILDTGTFTMNDSLVAKVLFSLPFVSVIIVPLGAPSNDTV